MPLRLLANAVSLQRKEAPMAQWMTLDEVKQHFRVPGIKGCYLLVCDGTWVNVRSQQIRALNLLHALASGDKNEIKDKRVAVIGGEGVDLLEKGLGCTLPE